MRVVLLGGPKFGLAFRSKRVTVPRTHFLYAVVQYTQVRTSTAVSSQSTSSEPRNLAASPQPSGRGINPGTMEITTSTGVRGTALSGGPPTKATDDGSPPLTGKAPAEALSVGGEKPTTTQAPADDVRIAAARAIALLRSGEDGSIPQVDAEALFKYLVDKEDTEAMETFYDHVFGLPAQMHLGKLIGEQGAVGNSIYKKVEEGPRRSQLSVPTDGSDGAA